MPWTSTIPFFIWGIITIPLTILVWKKQPNDTLTSLVALVAYILVHLFFVLVVNWSLINYWLRLLPVLLTLVVAFLLLVKPGRPPFLPQKSKTSLGYLAISLLILLPAAWLNSRVLRSFNHPDEAVLMLLPVRNGLYVIVNGGNALDGLGMNNLARPLFNSELPPNDAMAYGFDIMRMGIRGSTRISGPANRTFLKYEGYNDMVYSPCNGQVVHTEDGHPDVEVNGQGVPLGNYVVIQCADYYVTLANLRSGSLLVEAGDPVNFEMSVGNVGNSGVPAIPHLHLHATKGSWRPGEGEPVPMLFPGLEDIDKFYVRNDLTINNKE